MDDSILVFRLNSSTFSLRIIVNRERLSRDHGSDFRKVWNMMKFETRTSDCGDTDKVIRL